MELEYAGGVARRRQDLAHGLVDGLGTGGLRLRRTATAGQEQASIDTAPHRRRYSTRSKRGLRTPSTSSSPVNMSKGRTHQPLSLYSGR